MNIQNIEGKRERNGYTRCKSSGIFKTACNVEDAMTFAYFIILHYAINRLASCCKCNNICNIVDVIYIIFFKMPVDDVV